MGDCKEISRKPKKADRQPSLQDPGEERVDFGYRLISAREKATHVLRYFNAIARKYDIMNTLLSFGLHHRWKRLSVEALGLKSGESVIDVCGGTADLSLLAARAVGAEGRVILCDFSRAMIAEGASKIRRASLEERILPVQGDAESLSFSTGAFDAAMVGFGIRNLTHMEKGLAEMHRVLGAGGRLMCLEFSLPVSGWFRLLYDFYSFHLMPLAGKVFAGNRDIYTYLPETIRKLPPPGRIITLIEEAGFSAVSCRRLTNGIAVIYTGVKR